MTAPSNLRPLAALERTILYLDRRHQPLHVGCLMLLTPPDSAPDFARRIRQRLRAAKRPLPPLDCRLERRLGGSWWVKHADFDIDQHLVSQSLPQPGRMQDLIALVARLHELHLDRAFPLWRMYLIEGLNDGRLAIYCKMHRALGDGETGIDKMLRSVLGPQQARSSRATHSPRGHSAAAGGFAHRWRSGLDALVEVLLDVRQTARDVKSGCVEAVGGRQAPVSIFNRPISASREFAMWSCDLSRVKNLGRHFSCGTHQIVLAVCASALSSFCEEQDALPEHSLIAMVPTSMPSSDANSGWSRVPLVVNLGTELSDPVERLHRIVRSLEYSRERYVGLNTAQANAYTLAISGRGLVNLLLDPSGGRLPFNLMISEVSPSDQMDHCFGDGCRPDGLYPMPAVIDGLALGIAFAARGDGLDFGLVACRRTLPRAQRLTAHLEGALKELESRTGRRFAQPPKPERARPFPRSSQLQRRA